MTAMTMAAIGGDYDREDGLLTAEEAATRLRCSANTLERWRREGRGPRFQKVGYRHVRYFNSDIEAFARGRAA
jgi:excisionase family DNA binding protein